MCTYTTYTLSSDFAKSTVIWGANDTHNMKELVLVVASAEERDARYHFRKNAPAGPDVNGSAVRPRAHQHVRCTVPQRDDLGYVKH